MFWKRGCRRRLLETSHLSLRSILSTDLRLTRVLTCRSCFRDGLAWGGVGVGQELALPPSLPRSPVDRVFIRLRWGESGHSKGISLHNKLDKKIRISFPFRSVPLILLGHLSDGSAIYGNRKWRQTTWQRRPEREKYASPEKSLI